MPIRITPPALPSWNSGTSALSGAITPSMTLAVNYVGNESHFIVNSGSPARNARG